MQRMSMEMVNTITMVGGELRRGSVTINDELIAGKSFERILF